MATFPRTRPSDLVDRTVRPIPVGTDVARQVLCPRCGSAHVVPALHDVPSEGIHALRGGDLSGSAVGEFDIWLCSLCGHRWPHERPPAPAPRVAPTVNGGGKTTEAPRPDAAVLLQDLMELPDVGEQPIVDRGGSPYWSSLRRAREQRGLALSDVSRATKISEHDLELLERDAPVEALQGRTYARFSLRQYAEFLGFDPDATIREFDQRHPLSEPLPIQPLSGRRRWWRIAAIVVVLGLGVGLAAVGYGSFSKTHRDDVGSAASIPSPGHAPSTRHRFPSMSRGVRAVLQLAQPTWVRAVADGAVLERSTVTSTDPVVFHARRVLRLVIGNGGVVSLRVDGRAVETGPLGQQVRLTFHWRNGRVIFPTG